MSQEEPAGPDSCGTGSWSSVRSFSFSNPHSGCCHFYDAKSCTSPSPVPSTIVWRQTPSNEHEKKKGDLSIAPPVNLLEEFLTFAACSGRIISIWNVCTTFEGATKSRSGWSTNPAALQPYNCKNFFTPIGFFFSSLPSFETAAKPPEVYQLWFDLLTENEGICEKTKVWQTTQKTNLPPLIFCFCQFWWRKPFSSLSKPLDTSHTHFR